jgi:hypothetical protein
MEKIKEMMERRDEDFANDISVQQDDAEEEVK